MPAPIPQHLSCRGKVSVINEQLASRAHQLRVVEKRLLVRLKDRNPVPMHNLELILEGTYQQLLQLADMAAEAQEQLIFQNARLSAGTRLLLLLLRLRFALSPEDATVLEAHLSSLVDETPDQGWEVQSARCQLLISMKSNLSLPLAPSRASSDIFWPKGLFASIHSCGYFLVVLGAY